MTKRNRAECSECRAKLAVRNMYACVACGSLLCQRCAEPHHKTVGTMAVGFATTAADTGLYYVCDTTRSERVNAKLVADANVRRGSKSLLFPRLKLAPPGVTVDDWTE